MYRFKLYVERESQLRDSDNKFTSGVIIISPMFFIQ